MKTLVMLCAIICLPMFTYAASITGEIYPVETESIEYDPITRGPQIYDPMRPYLKQIVIEAICEIAKLEGVSLVACTHRGPE